MSGQPERTVVRIAIDDEDHVALTRVFAGDSDAYADVVRNHIDTARRTAAVLGAGNDVDDIVQDAFVKAYQALGRFRADAAFRPWLLRIVANETRNHHRARHRRTAREHWSALLDDRVGPDAVDPAASALAEERRKELVAMLQRLPDAQLMVVTCRYLLDFDERETAAVLGLRLGTVKSRLHRALRALREGLAQPGDVDGSESRSGRGGS